MAVLAGTGFRGRQDGPVDEATFSLPNDLSISKTGDTLYINHVAPLVGSENIPSVLRAVILNTPVSTEPTEPTEAPSLFEVGAAFPNPTSGRFRLPLQLISPSTVSVNIYDVRGRILSSPIGHQSLGAGSHELAIPIDGLPPGSYVYRLAVMPRESGAFEVSTVGVFAVVS